MYTDQTRIVEISKLIRLLDRLVVYEAVATDQMLKTASDGNGCLCTPVEVLTAGSVLSLSEIVADV